MFLPEIHNLITDVPNDSKKGRKKKSPRKGGEKKNLRIGTARALNCRYIFPEPTA